ncbi:hypothetical protein DERP_010454 [Dermatophagoides pteronyssinus]|uniref:Uncharacterized protein n=1 Tax=Dermatophagoides pteronyssinus TaxID=6956 RepID=A0ABQ8J533_DERPT|nr:hypothetical protein DERP_010454 [Dermatophagoides pteronyssinus]
MANNSVNESRKHSPESIAVPVQIFILNFMAVIIAIIFLICRNYLITEEMSCLPTPVQSRHKELSNSSVTVHSKNSTNNRGHRYTVRRKYKKFIEPKRDFKIKIEFIEKIKDSNLKLL